MSHVRLPIYGDNGMPTPGYLEIEIGLLQMLADLNNATNLVRVIEPRQPWPGTRKDCAVEGCELEIIYMGEGAGGWWHYNNTSYISHKAIPKEN